MPTYLATLAGGGPRRTEPGHSGGACRAGESPSPRRPCWKAASPSASASPTTARGTTISTCWWRAWRRSAPNWRPPDERDLPRRTPDALRRGGDGRAPAARPPSMRPLSARSGLFRHILQLETETKARLRPLLLRYGMSLAEGRRPGGIPARLAGYVSQTWREYNAATATRLAGVLRDYEAIAALGQAEDTADPPGGGSATRRRCSTGRGRGGRRDRSVAGGDRRPAVLSARARGLRAIARRPGARRTPRSSGPPPSARPRQG